MFISILVLSALILFIISGLIFFLKFFSRKQTDENINLLLNALPISCQLWNKNFKMIDSNNASIELYGYKIKHEFLDMFIEHCSPEYQPDGQRSEEKAHMVVNKAFEEGYFKTEWMHKHVNGELIPSEVILIRVKQIKGDDLVATYTRDLREHKAYIKEIEEIQEDLRKARDTAETANRIKSTFLANMSHEIRTPMNSIIGFAELAQQSNNTEKMKEYLSNILQSSKWLLKIINDILDISKIEFGKITLERIPFDLHDVLAQCRMIIKPKAEEKKIALFCYADMAIKKKMMGDPIRLHQALINLLSNAVKFTNVGTVELLVTLIDSNNEKINIHFEVKDSGIGMNVDQIAKIITPILQSDKEIADCADRVGLGLAITKNIIELMGGNLCVESEQGVGSKFSFNVIFDLIDEETEAVLRDHESSNMEKPNFAGNVLVCEDNKMSQQVVYEHLTRVGLKTIIAHNGFEGVKHVIDRIKNEKKPFDLIFMDIQMPEMDGLEAASEITVLGVKTPIVALTANIMSSDVELYRKNGILDYLGKPFTSQELWKLLKKYLPVLYYSAENSSINEITDMSEDDEKFIKQIKSNFVRNNQDTFANITAASKNNDFKLARRLAHSLKGNAGQIDESKLQAAASVIENMLAQEINPLQKEEIKILETELNIVLKKLSPLLVEIELNKKNKINDAVVVREIFANLEPMLENKNPECEELLSEIQRIPGAENLANYIDNFNFKQALIELSKLKKEWE